MCFSGETDEDFAETVDLIKEYKFPHVHISQFYPRPGTPAARMKKVPSNIVKKRSRELTTVFESFTPYEGMEGQVERIWITEYATDGVHLVLVVAPETMLGTSTEVKITSVGRWSVFGEVIETEHFIKEVNFKDKESNPEIHLPCSDLNETCQCSRQSDPCALQCCGDQSVVQEITISRDKDIRNLNGQKLIGWFLKKRKGQEKERKESENELKSKWKHGKATRNTVKFGIIDWILLGGMLVSLLTIVLLLLPLGHQIYLSR
ncbi:hypothetical protein AQUCO_136900001v1 [Aquilegia coerulea]|uniref:TRAM domain-containing protein n=1 Tax=Aquilegia coerulea TaxID=218851 RepID=A0A2G5C077_AQUCA|nr:hypothetical protein AQUCO_136900001v1 [Aquilegia coerulea]